MPGLATSWEVDPADKQKWTFKLRAGVTFHDGCPWNAESAIWNFKRVRDAKSPQFNTRHVGMIGYTTVSVAGVDKIDDLTIAIHAKSPNALFPQEMATYYMISNCAVEKDNYNWDALIPSP